MNCCYEWTCGAAKWSGCDVSIWAPAKIDNQNKMIHFTCAAAKWSGCDASICALAKIAKQNKMVNFFFGLQLAEWHPRLLGDFIPRECIESVKYFTYFTN